MGLNKDILLFHFEIKSFFLYVAYLESLLSYGYAPRMNFCPHSILSLTDNCDFHSVFSRSGPKLAAFEASDLTHFKGDIRSFQCGRRQVLENLQESLSHRFEDLNSSLIKATEILDFKSWPTKDEMAGNYYRLCDIRLK